MPAANASGYTFSEYFNAGGGAFVTNGHYKVTLYGKSTPGGQLGDVKAKSKVFKVTCSGIE